MPPIELTMKIGHFILNNYNVYVLKMLFSNTVVTRY